MNAMARRHPAVLFAYYIMTLVLLIVAATFIWTAVITDGN